MFRVINTRIEVYTYITGLLVTAPEIMISGDEEHVAEPIFQHRHGGNETGKRLGDVTSHEKDVVSEVDGRQAPDPVHVLRVVRVEIGEDEDAKRRRPGATGRVDSVESAGARGRRTTGCAGHVVGKTKKTTKILCHSHQLWELCRNDRSRLDHHLIIYGCFWTGFVQAKSEMNIYLLIFRGVSEVWNCKCDSQC